MRYEFLYETEEGVTIYAGIDDEGLTRVTCTAENPEYLAWLEDQKK